MTVRRSGQARGFSTIWALAIALVTVVAISPISTDLGLVSRPNGLTNSLALSSSMTLPPGGDFPTYLGNGARTSASSSELMVNPTTAPLLHLLWNYTAGGAVQSQPVEQNGVVYFGAQDGYEYAVRATTGALLWRTFLGQDGNDTACKYVLGVTSTATVSGPNLYVDGGFPYLYALNSSTGAIEWRALIGGSDSLGFYDWSSPLIYGHSAYVGIASDCDHPLVPAGVAEFSLTTHAMTHYFNSSAPEMNGSSIWGSPSVNAATNTIFVTTGNPHGATPSEFSESIIALNATTLAVESRWQVPAAAGLGDSDFGVSPTLFTPASGFPMVTAPNKNGFLYALYQSNLTLAWQQRICCANAQDDHFSTAWGGGYVYAVGANTTLGRSSYNSSVRAFNPSTGAEIWMDGFTESSYGGYAAPTWVNGTLIVPDGGALLVLDAHSGKLVDQINVGGETQAAASIARGEVFVGSTDGSVLAFDVALNSSASQSIGLGPTPLSVAFNVTGTGGLPPYRYSWTFGDGTNSTLQAPVHVYASLGIHPVEIVVTDQAGNISTHHLQVIVNLASAGPEPFPSITIEDVAIVGAILAAIAVVLVIAIRHRRTRPPDQATAGTERSGAGAADAPARSEGASDLPAESLSK